MILTIITTSALSLALGRLTAPRLPTVGDSTGVHIISRVGPVEVRRYGDEVDEVVIDDQLHIEVCAQPHADDPAGERYAEVMILSYMPDGERVHVSAYSLAPITLTVLEPTELACVSRKERP